MKRQSLPSRLAIPTVAIPTIAILILAAPVLTVPVQAQDDMCTVDATCQDASMTITVTLQNVAPPEDYQGVYVHRITLGQCDSETVLNPDDPLPLPEAGIQTIHELGDPITPGLGYHYRAVLVDNDGNVIPWAWPYSTHAVAGCDVWPISRGILVDADISGYALLESCECWFEAYAIDLSAVAPEVYQPLVGSRVELQGEAHWDPMPGSPQVLVSSIVPVESCDDPVAVRPRTWSAIKRCYD